MSGDKERHDYSLLGSFMPKETEDRPVIPVQLDMGPSKPPPPQAEEKDDKKR